MGSQPTAKDDEMIRLVLDEGFRAIKIGKAGVGALLLYGDEILALGHNESKETGDLTAHAEMVVLREAAFRLGQMNDDEKAKLTIFSTLEPCIMCTCAISVAGIKRVVYSALTEDWSDDQMIADDVTIHTLNPRLMRGSIDLIGGVRREEGKKLLTAMQQQEA